ncbi:hypothetical protein KUTeg_022524 [Tegillarca granosa]|uniref:G-protein coupled receptors family 1 profile domain-containing protein n=1 Tax=Tegillarca granosa TaxID=220873 RepID=A0ABQ9EC20_TEGGR|nr:hypothetical protein KUTeg_022524 [Tegillarca granosa]
MNYYYEGYDDYNYDENYTTYFTDGGEGGVTWYDPPSFIKNRLIPGIFVVIFIVGLFGNSLVLYVFMKNKPLRTVTHMFLVNLAVVDLVYIIMCIPFSTAFSWLGSWPFGNTLSTTNFNI